MPKPKNKTRKQHWVPQFYLRHFADGEGCLWACRHDSNKLFVTKTEGICYERDLYEVVFPVVENSSDFFMQNYIEDKLSGMEARLASSYRKLITCCDARSFTGQEFCDGRLAVCLLAAHLLVRHPQSIKAETERVPEFLDSQHEDYGLTSFELQLLEEMGWKGDYRVLTELAVEDVLLFSGDEGTPFSRLYNLFANKRMRILEACVGANFISASTPFFIIGSEADPYGLDFMYMPLSSKYAAFFISDDSMPVFQRLSLPEVDGLNQLLLFNAPLWETAFAIAKWPLEKAMIGWTNRD